MGTLSCDHMPQLCSSAGIMGARSGSISKAIPSWQLPKEPESSDKSDRQQAQPSEPSTPRSRPYLIEKASKFLDDEEIRAASDERKTYFLQTKGLTDEEITDLLAKKGHVPEIEVASDDRDKQEATTPINSVTAPSQSPNVDIMDDYIDSEPSSPQKEDLPPIITYPEFLLESRKPPPLITTDRLLTALYLASGAAATMYGLNNYVVEPMVESLGSARHSFFKNASSNIDKLNDKLKGTVSKVPDGVNDEEERDAEDSGSVSSDPARFFSRTIATQTSPRLSRSASSASFSEGPSSAIVNHTSHLSRIHELLSDLNHEEHKVSDPVKDNVQALTEYLKNLSYWGRNGRTGAANEPILDGVARVKAEIKNVKGSLLSARNFPASIKSR